MQKKGDACETLPGGLWLHFCFKLMSFSQVDTVSPGNIFKGVQKGILHVLLWVEGEKKLGPCYGSAGIHSGEE